MDVKVTSAEYSVDSRWANITNIVGFAKSLKGKESS